VKLRGTAMPPSSFVHLAFVIQRSPQAAAFPFIVQETGRKPAKLEIEVQVLVKGPLFHGSVGNR
jgi:hypothetical protein